MKIPATINISCLLLSEMFLISRLPISKEFKKLRRRRQGQRRLKIDFAFSSRISRHSTMPFNNMRTLTFKAQPTNAFFAAINQVFSDSSKPTTTYCRACGNQIVERNLGNETVLGSCRKLGGAAEHLNDGSEKRICRLSFDCFALSACWKGAVKSFSRFVS